MNAREQIVWGQELPNQIKHHDDFQELRRSAANGCFVCGLLQRKWLNRLEESNQATELRDLADHHSYKLFFHWELIFQSNTDTWVIMVYTYDLRVDSLSGQLCWCWNDDGVPRTLKPGAKRWVFELRRAHHWLQSCLGSHGQCQAHSAQPFVPSRLLCVFASKLGDAPRWRLVDTKGQTKYAKYATLSYCWGKISFLTLRKTNQNVLRQGLPDAALPKTHRHAVQIARVLGLKYLWIDSLCIIQDSPSDWQYQALTMHDVFRNSACTIAAQWGIDADAGCIPNPPRLYSGHLEIEGLLKRTMSKEGAHVHDLVQPTSARPSRIPSRQGLPGKAFYEAWTVNGANDESQRLTKRAWACQELLLR